MVEAGAVLNIITLLVSIGAATISLRALGLNRNANQLPIIVNLLSKWREVEFMEREEVLWSEMPNCPQSMGFRDLPQPIKSYAFEVGQYYQCLAYLSVHSIADYDLIAPQVRYRALRTWNAIERNVGGEREIRGGKHTFFNTFETFVMGLRAMDIEKMDEEARRRSLRWNRRHRLGGG